MLSRHRTSSVCDSLEDISVRLDDISSIGAEIGDTVDTSENGDRYEKDIREIVMYFERNCQMSKSSVKPNNLKSFNENVRSQKIESLIKKVAENKSRNRPISSKFPAQQYQLQQQQQHQQLQICSGIVQSKLPLFDKRRELLLRDNAGARKTGLTQSENVKIVTKPSN